MERAVRGVGPDDRLVFISHSGLDTWVAMQVARAIAEVGAKTFLDAENIQVGDEFDDEILSALDRADEMVVLLTPTALERPYVWAEVGAAWLARIRIVALYWGLTASEVVGNPRVPNFLKSRNLLDLNELDTYLDQLRARVRAGRARAPAEGVVDDQA